MVCFLAKYEENDISKKSHSESSQNTLRNAPDLELLCSELLNIEQLKRYAITLASEYRIDTQPGPNRLLSRLLDNESILLATYDLVTEAATRGERILLGEAWLLDNFFLIEQQITQVRRH